MIVYSASKKDFCADVFTNGIDDIVERAYLKATGYDKVNLNEKKSWAASLGAMDRVIDRAGIPDDASISIEYHIPRSSRRVDFIVSGLDAKHRNSVVIVELKQWQEAGLTDKDAIVTTRYKGGMQETEHPSYQAWSYMRLIQDYNQAVEDDKIALHPCAYLHNYAEDGVIKNEFYAEHIGRAPVFLKTDAQKLCDFIKERVHYGDKNQIMYRIDNGNIRPSKSLVAELKGMLKGNDSFVMIGKQKVVYENALQLAQRSTATEKNVLIVEGGPGTGKSVLAINLLVEVMKRGLVAQYVTRNSAPRKVFEAMLTRSFKKSHISNLFSGSGTYHSLTEDTYDCLVVDEAHRLTEKSGMFDHLGANQVMELIRSSKFSVFFVDENQKVTLKDIGDKEEIKRWAVAEGATVTELVLDSQFRCNGSDGYLAWLNNTLGVKDTANVELEPGTYDFRVFGDPGELHEIIRAKNAANNKSRIVAGYCWDWVSRNNPQAKDIVIGNYEATWNLDPDGQAWIIKPNSVSEVGCIHTCQGLELDYVGVIIGPDLIVREGEVITRPEHRSGMDRSVRGMIKLLKENPAEGRMRLDAIIKNTYRVLMTRGQKGCYVYSEDPETRTFFTDRSTWTGSL